MLLDRGEDECGIEALEDDELGVRAQADVEHQPRERGRRQARQQDILRDPAVIVQVKEYNSRRVTLLGQVAKPGSFPLTPGMTLVQAISLAGGLTSIAKSDQVRLTRTTNGKAVTVVLDVEAITDGVADDVPLQAGDRIYVEERLF